MKLFSQELSPWYAPYQPEGWRGAIKPIWQIVIGAVLLTCVVSIICFLVIRKKSKKVNTDPSANKNSRKVSAVKKGCVMLSGIVVLSSLIFVVIGALPPSDINDISPAIGARFKIASYFVFGTQEVVRVYMPLANEMIQTDLSELPKVLTQKPEGFISFDGTYTHRCFEVDRSPLELGGIIFRRPEAYFDAITVEALNVEGKGVVPIHNQYFFSCNGNPKYTLILYDTDMGYIVALYGATGMMKDDQSFPQIFYFAYEDFIRYAQRDYVLTMEHFDEAAKSGERLKYGYEDPAGYNPLNVTLITEEKGWNNSHEAILYIIACAILHVALVCAIWYGGYRLYQKKRRSTPPADPNTEEAPKSDTE